MSLFDAQGHRILSKDPDAMEEARELLTFAFGLAIGKLQWTKEVQRQWMSRCVTLVGKEVLEEAFPGISIMKTRTEINGETKIEQPMSDTVQ